MAVAHILLKEEEIHLQHSIALMLKQACYRVSVASNTGEAMATMRKYRNTSTAVDLLIADMDFAPSEKYHCFLRTLSQGDVAVPFLIIAEETAASMVESLMIHGCRAHITKPFAPELLLRSIKTALRHTA
ncbi:response regulator [Thiovibrio sp. JS02]